MIIHVTDRMKEEAQYWFRLDKKIKREGLGKHNCLSLRRLSRLLGTTVKRQRCAGLANVMANHLGPLDFCCDAPSDHHEG